jgi:hypothetical protein
LPPAGLLIFSHFQQDPDLQITALGAGSGAWFQFTIDRKGEYPASHLSNYKWWVHADGNSGFNGLFGNGKASEVACTTHIRSKIIDVQHIRKMLY